MPPYFVAALVAVPAFVILGDLLYFLIARVRYARWEAGIERDADGVRLGCREFTLGDGDEAVLLVHGFGDSPSVYQRMAPALAAKGFACHGLRLPRHALTMTRYKKTSGAQWSDAVRSAVKELRGRHKRVYLIAHSLGAAVSLEAVADPASAVDAITLLAPLFDVSNRRSPVLPARVWYRLLDGVLVFTDAIQMAFPPDLWDRDALPLTREDKFIPRVVIREVFRLVARNRGRAAAFHTPLLMILARHDLVVDNVAAERFFQECAAEPKRLRFVEDAGHMLPIDRGWDRIVDEAAEFFRGKT